MPYLFLIPFYNLLGLLSYSSRFWCRQDCRSDKTRSAPRRCGLCCHDVTPDHRGLRLPWDRNCELAFVNLLRQFDANNHASCIVECLESQHRLQSPLHPAVVLLHNTTFDLPVMAVDHRVPEVGLRPFEEDGGPHQDRSRQRAWRKTRQFS